MTQRSRRASGRRSWIRAVSRGGTRGTRWGCVLETAHEAGWQIDRFHQHVGRRSFCVRSHGAYITGAGQLLIANRPHMAVGTVGAHFGLGACHLTAAGQQFGDGIGDHHVAVSSFEANDEAEIPCSPLHTVPREPEAVRRSHSGMAEVVRQLLGGKDVFLFGSLLGRIVSLGIERIDDDRAVHFDRLVLVLAVEEDSSPKSANA